MHYNLNVVHNIPPPLDFQAFQVSPELNELSEIVWRPKIFTELVYIIYLFLQRSGIAVVTWNLLGYLDGHSHSEAEPAKNTYLNSVLPPWLASLAEWYHANLKSLDRTS